MVIDIHRAALLAVLSFMGLFLPRGDVLADSRGVAPDGTVWTLHSKRFQYAPTFEFAAACQTVGVECVKVSNFGYDAADATAIVQKALDSGAKKVVFDAATGPWTVGPVFVRGDTVIEFEEGSQLLAKPGEFLPVRSALINLVSVTNVTLRGLGSGATVRMRYDDYFKPPYQSGEWRHALNVMSSVNVTVENLTFADSGGDGIYLGTAVRGCPNENVVIRKCVCDHNNRQGISVISARHLLVEDTVVKNTRGKPPQAGFDFEPNSADEVLEGCIVRNCVSENNKGNGYEFFLSRMTARSRPVSVRVENCIARGNNCSVSVGAATDRADDFATGLVHFRNCSFQDAKSAGIYVFSKPSDAVQLRFDDCEISGCKAGWMGADVQLRNMGLWQPYVGGMAFNNLRIAQTSLNHPWFGYHEQSFSPVPAAGYAGTVMLTDAKGAHRRVVTLDEKWAAENLPAPRPLALRELPIPKQAPAVKSFDACAGKMTRYPALRAMQKTEYAFYAAESGAVRIRATCIDRSGRGLDANQNRELVAEEMFGKSVVKAMPDASSGEHVFNVPRAGIYRLKAGVYRYLLQVDEANVPLALNVWGRLQMTQDELDGFSLYVRPRGDRAFAFLSCGYGAAGCHAARLLSPIGEAVAEAPCVHSWNALEATGGAAGLWKVKIAPVKGRHYGYNRFGMLGEAGFLFLDPKRTWSLE